MFAVYVKDGQRYKDDSRYARNLISKHNSFLEAWAVAKAEATAKFLEMELQQPDKWRMWEDSSHKIIVRNIFEEISSSFEYTVFPSYD